MTTSLPFILHPQTVAISAACRGTDGLAPVLQPSTAFGAASANDAGRRATRPRPVDFYGRYGNPTVQTFAEAVAELEGAEAGLCTSSGMAAISSVVLALCGSGDHIVTQRQLFAGTMQLFTQVCPRFGIDVTFVDVADAQSWTDAVESRTKVVFAETPSNPTLDLVDLASIGAIRGPVTVVDSTLATPLIQRPIDHGIDLVVHSATKALSGHNDATIGVVVGDKTIVNEVWGFSVVQGSSASAFDAWNGLRGLKTLGVRVKHQNHTAHALAQLLQTSTVVERVYYPGLATHPQAELASRQMSAGGGCVTFDIAGGYPAAAAFVEALEIAALAPSLGGPDTLVNHPASMTHAALSPEQRATAGIGDGQIRISAGLEDTEDLCRDLCLALQFVEGS